MKKVKVRFEAEVEVADNDRHLIFENGDQVIPVCVLGLSPVTELYLIVPVDGTVIVTDSYPCAPEILQRSTNNQGEAADDGDRRRPRVAVGEGEGTGS
jgi:hypothetical protein